MPPQVCRRSRSAASILLVVPERSRKFTQLGIKSTLDVEVVSTPRLGSLERLTGGALHAEPGALHGAVRSRARIWLEQIPAWRRNPDDFCRHCPARPHQMDLGNGIVCGRVEPSVSGSPHRRKSSGIFSGTDVPAGWANLGRKRNMDVSDWCTPQADLGRYPVSASSEAVAPLAKILIRLRNGGGLY